MAPKAPQSYLSIMADAPARRRRRARRSRAAKPQRWSDGLCGVAEGDFGVSKQKAGGEACRSTGEGYAERLESLDPCFHARLLRVHVRAGAEKKRISQDGGFEPDLHSIAIATSTATAIGRYARSVARLARLARLA